MSLNILTYNTSGYTVPVWPVFFPHNYTLNTTMSGRTGIFVQSSWSADTSPFTPSNTVLTNIGTIQTQNFESQYEVNGNTLAENFVINYTTLFNTGTNTTDEIQNFSRYSIKKVVPEFSEGFSRNLTFVSMQSAATYNANYQLSAFNFSAPHNLKVGDRIQIFPDSLSITKYNNAIAKVLLTTSATQILTDLKWDTSTPTGFSGNANLGEELYDYQTLSGRTQFVVDNPTRLNENDRLYVQMDPVSVVTLKFVSGNTGSINGIYVDNTNILTAPISYNTSPEQTIADVVNEINTNLSYNYSGITAFSNVSSNGDVMFIYSPLNYKTEFDGVSFSATSTGNIALAFDTAFYSDFGINGTTGVGWNPQLTNTYIAGPITENIGGFDYIEAYAPIHYDNPIGSNRGSIFSPNFEFGDSLSGEPYYALYSNMLVNYDDVDFIYQDAVESRAIPSVSGTTCKFLTNGPNTLYYSTLQEPYVLSVLYNKDECLSIDAVKIEVIKTGGSFEYYSYTDDIITQARTGFWEIVNFGVGTLNINSYDTTNFDTPAPVQPIIDDTTTEYRITLIHNYGTKLSPNYSAISETIVFKYKCFPKDFKKIYWTNRWGGTDGFHFYGNWERVLNVSRTEFVKKPVWQEPNINETGNNIFTSNSFETFKVSTGWLSQAETTWVKEIYTSPFMILLGTDTYTGFFATPLDTEIVLPINPNSTLRQLSVTLRNNFTQINQRN